MPDSERMDDCVALDWISGNMSLIPHSATNLHCDLGQVSSSLRVSVPHLKMGGIILLSCLFRIEYFQGGECLFLWVCTAPSAMGPLGTPVRQIITPILKVLLLFFPWAKLYVLPFACHSCSSVIPRIKKPAHQVSKLDVCF